MPKVPVNSQELRLQLADKGWTQKGLAKKAKLSVRTVNRIFNGKDAYPSTMQKVATAFELPDLRPLIIGPEPLDPPKDPAIRTWDMSLLTPGDFDKIDETELIEETEAQLRRALAVIAYLKIKRARPGNSVAIDIEMDQGAIHDLIALLASRDSGYFRPAKILLPFEFPIPAIFVARFFSSIPPMKKSPLICTFDTKTALIARRRRVLKRANA